MSGRVRLGIIGAGAIARDIHMPSFLKLGNKVEIIAVTDNVKEDAENFAASFGIENVYQDFYDMLEQMDSDAVSVCTPNKYHVAATIAALDAGCHVLCEKPPSMNAEEAKRMADAAKKAGNLLTYGSCYHFAP